MCKTKGRFGSKLAVPRAPRGPGPIARPMSSRPTPFPWMRPPPADAGPARRAALRIATEPVQTVASPTSLLRRVALHRVGIAGDLARELVGAVSLDVELAAPARYISPGRDLFIITAFCGGNLETRALDEHGPLDIVVALLRTSPVPFFVTGNGDMTIALVTPAGFLRAFGVPTEGACDTRLPMEQLVGRAEAQRLLGLLRSAPVEERGHVLAAWVEQRGAARRTLETTASRVCEAVAAVQDAQGRMTVDDIAGSIGMHRRQLERDFRHWLGVSPGEFERLARLQRAATDLHRGGKITDVSFGYGFSDQPHLTRVLRSLTLATPREITQQGRQRDHSLLRDAFAQRLLLVESHD